MYETYTRYIYQWLTENDIAGKLDSLITSSDNIVKAVVFFGFVFIGFKLMRKEWLSI